MKFTGYKDSNGKDIYLGCWVDLYDTNMSRGQIIFEEGVYKMDGTFNKVPLKDIFEAIDFEFIFISEEQ